jgi:hypothetical protein
VPHPQADPSVPGAPDVQQIDADAQFDLSDKIPYCVRQMSDNGIDTSRWGEGLGSSDPPR